MHVSSFTTPLSLDPNPNSYPDWSRVFQFLVTAFVIGLGLLHLLRSTASKYLVAHANFNSSSSSTMSGEFRTCAVCGTRASKFCAACKNVYYCSMDCQQKHWKSHRMQCQSSGKLKPRQQTGEKRSRGIALVPSNGTDKMHKVVDKVLFPYDEFIKVYDWDKPIFPPCGLLNCGNSCFANVVLQCLVHTRPLLEYLLGKGHRRNCKRDGWCFLCELEFFMTSVSKAPKPFSPMNILSRLRSIGGNLGYGDQEDAHEFMRFSIGTMQSVCLDEHGGEKVIDHKSQETTLIQHIFGGQLRSQVICTKCNQVSNQYENMMDLTVEIQGDATSLQECLDQFTAREWLDGENMYKCDGCKDYVKAWKRLSIHQAPNVLTIALKRFQSGKFGKINKKIYFPETLDLSPYMNEERGGMDIYKLYAVIVHVDMLNASFFGHYICYTKGFEGGWYRIDDCKVMRVELDEVLSQGAYMLLYRRVVPRPQCLKTFEAAKCQQQTGEKTAIVAESSSTIQTADASYHSGTSNSHCGSVNVAADVSRQLNHGVNGDLNGYQTVIPVSDPSVAVNVLENGNGTCSSAHRYYEDLGIPRSFSVGVDSKEDANDSLIDTKNSAIDTLDQAALCERNSKVESVRFSDVEVQKVQLNESEPGCLSNGVINGVIDNVSRTNSWQCASSEKAPCVHD